MRYPWGHEENRISLEVSLKRGLCPLPRGGSVAILLFRYTNAAFSEVLCGGSNAGRDMDRMLAIYIMYLCMIFFWSTGTRQCLGR